ncbi:MAG TPA: hypothetical protein VN736_18160 [Candidatus Limnocylindrales bacterium]|nr:hypothetical protein [Candidatus Limnocylindrales bacterium]
MTTDERFDRIDAAVERLTQAVERLTQYVLEFRSESVRRFESLEKRIDIVSGNVSALEAKIGPYTKATEEFAASMTHIGRVLRQHTGANFDPAAWPNSKRTSPS